ncbi:MAG: transcriptional repressor [Caldithrix sp.]|nr:transcriptional repressor [Caldithrix sp.]
MEYNTQPLEYFIESCRKNNLKVTPQRMAIFQALVQDGSHPNPEIIYNRVRAKHPTISFATVYKTLETFEKFGLITRVTRLHDTVRYDPEIEPHHHIICVKCRKVINLFDEGLNNLPVPREVTSSNHVVDYSVHFNVVCEDCNN